MQRQITHKRYNSGAIENHTNENIFNDLERLLYAGFKVTPFFDAEYLRNGTRYRHCFNEILLKHSLLNIVISNDLE